MLTSSAKFLVPSAWHQVLGTKYFGTKLGTEYLVSSTWYQGMGLGTWYQGNRFGISLWFGVGLETVLDGLGIGLGSVWGRFGINVGAIWDRFGIVFNQNPGYDSNKLIRQGYLLIDSRRELHGICHCMHPQFGVPYMPHGY